MSVPAPVVCEPQTPPCCEGAPVFYGQGLTYLSAQTGFLLTCPPGFSCDAGAYPHPIIVPHGTIPFTPPTGANPLRITCCDGVVLASYLPDGFTQAQFDAAAQSLVDQAAEHLAGCMAADYNAAHAQRRLKFDTSLLPPACFDADYSEPILMSSGVPPYNFTLLSGALPSGITMSEDGILSGVANAIGTFSFQVQVTDSANAIGIKTFSIRSVVISTLSPGAFSPGVPYSYQLDILGPTVAPVTWSIVVGSLPPGLSLSPDGLISGTPDPTTTDEFLFTVQVVDDGTPPVVCTANIGMSQFCTSIATNVRDILWGLTGGGTGSITAGNGSFDNNPSDANSLFTSTQLCTDVTYSLTVTIPFSASGVIPSFPFDIRFRLLYNGVPVATADFGGSFSAPWTLNDTAVLTAALPTQSVTQLRISILKGAASDEVSGTIAVSPLTHP